MSTREAASKSPLSNNNGGPSTKIWNTTNPTVRAAPKAMPMASVNIDSRSRPSKEAGKEEVEPWQPDDRATTAVFGPNDEEFFENVRRENKAKKAAAAVDQPSRPLLDLDDLETTVVQWEQPTFGDSTLYDVLRDRLKQDLPPTYKIVDPALDVTKPKIQQRMLQNLHRQLSSLIAEARLANVWKVQEKSFRDRAECLAGRKLESLSGLELQLWEQGARNVVRALLLALEPDSDDIGPLEQAH